MNDPTPHKKILSGKKFIEVRFAKLVGLPCWQVERGQGSFLTMEFGKPHLRVREPTTPRRRVSARIRETLMRRFVRPQGEWCFWVYCADWQFRMKGKLAGDSSSKRAIERAIRAMDGQILTGISLYHKKRQTVLHFDLGGRLVITPNDQESELWHLYEPSGKVLTYRADNMFTYQSRSVSGCEENWQRVL